MKKRAMILTAVLTAAVLAGGGYFPTDIGNRLTQTVSAAKKDSDKKDDTIVVEGNKNPEANKGNKLPNTGAEISFAIVLAGALALVGAGLALINEKKKIS